MAENSARACSSVAPGASRPNISSQEAWRWVNLATMFGLSRCSAASGTQTSRGVPIVTPVNCSLATPTTVKSCPSSLMVVAAMSAAPPKRRRQSRALITATGSAVARSSAGESRRPCAGVTPSTSK